MSDPSLVQGVNRRRFLKAGYLGAVGMFLGSGKGLPLIPAAKANGDTGGHPEFFGPPVTCAVIGIGPRGREILERLSQIPGVTLAAACDHYGPALRRVTRDYPTVKTTEEYREILDDPDIQAVVVATPSHLHREIAVAALDAGKHVYCEAPLASSIEDARAIAQAAKKAEGRLIFQTGLQRRAEPQHLFVQTFVQTGSLGTQLTARSQAHRKESWRRVAPTNERERELNWRLRRESSSGLLGENGIHGMDVMRWFIGELPVSVTGFGSLRLWRDGREVEDTAQAVFEYPGGILHTVSCNLGNSYEGTFDTIYGSDSAILMRDTRAWMFREADAPLLGWEVYARQEHFMHDTGISLMADATQLADDGVDLASVELGAGNPLHAALADFIECVREDIAPHAGYQEGFEAAVMAVKANESVISGNRAHFAEADFDLS